jgi:glucokinase
MARGVILAGDVGGTKTLLGLFQQVSGKLRLVRHASFASADSPSLESIVERFLAAGRERVRRCAVGVAGPVVRGRSHVVNVRWPVDAGVLAHRLGLGEAHLLNDLEATAWAVGELPATKLVSLTPRVRPDPGNAALIAAGTGLGTAILFWDGQRHLPSASEGGHQGFSPRDREELELVEFMLERHQRVSVERLVAGPGILAVYEFLIRSGRVRESASMRRRLAGAEDPNAAITEAGVRGEDRAAARAVRWFASMYGAAAGDLALVSRAVGGVYVGGGIAPKILPLLRDGTFLRAFRDKGRLSPLLRRIPVRVILEPRAALFGAAAYAARRR